MAETLIPGIDEEDDRYRRAELYKLAAQALAPLQPEVSVEQLDQINRIGLSSVRSIRETNRPASQDGIRIGPKDDLALLQAIKVSRTAPNASILSKEDTKLPQVEKTRNAAARSALIAPLQNNSPYAVSSGQSSSSTKIDPQAGTRLIKEAVRYLTRIHDRAKAGELSADQMADALTVPRDEIAEHALDEAVHKLSKNEGNVLTNYPNVAREMLNLGIQMESFKTDELEKYKKQGDEYRIQIQNLLKFSALLDKLPSDRESYDLSAELLNPVFVPPSEDSLTNEEIERCIKEVFPNGSYVISKEQLSGGKVRTNDIMGEYKTKMTNLLTTEISVVIHNLQMMAQMMQEIAKKQHQLVSSIVSHYGGR